jgi:hypothetical protein
MFPPVEAWQETTIVRSVNNPTKGLRILITRLGNEDRNPRFHPETSSLKAIVASSAAPPETFLNFLTEYNRSAAAGRKPEKPTKERAFLAEDAGDAEW